jgi:hypothetical protein
MCNDLFNYLSLSNSRVITALIVTCHFHLSVLCLTKCVTNTYLKLTDINIHFLYIRTLYAQWQLR